MDPRLRTINVRKALSAIADIAMPRVCVVCGRQLIPQENCICTECLADLPKTFFSKMSHNPMADKFNALIEDKVYCYASALYYYDDDAGYKKISQSLKYQRDFKVGKYFGRLLGEELRNSTLYDDVDVIIPVPLHWTRRWKRGYNQSDVISKAIAEVMDCRIDRKALKRIKKTKTQTAVNIDEKADNVKNAFVTKTSKKYKHILLVDDVFTSGSTLSSCHAALHSCLGDSVRISAVALAFVK